MMRKSFAAAFAAILFVSALVTAPPAEARREWQAFGGPGDATTKLECPAGQVLVGIEGRAGDWITQLRIVCAPFNGAFSTGAPQALGAYLGGRIGGRGGTWSCPANATMTTLFFYLTPDKRRVAQLTFACTNANGETRLAGGLYGNGDTEGCGKALGILPKGCDPEEGARSQTCPQEQFVGLTVRSGLDINAIGVICDRRDPPRAAAPPPPPPAAAAPQRPIKTTGSRAGVSLPPATFIAQPWSIVATPGTPFRLVFHENDGPGSLWGEMLFADAKLNGTVIGKLSDDGRIFTFTYEQPKVGVSGSGSLKIYTSRIMGGRVTTDQDGQTIQWAGHF